MEILITEFKEFCDKMLSTKERSDLVYKFYKKLKPAASPSEKFMNLTQRRKKNLEYLLNHYGEETFIRGIEEFNKKWESGTLGKNTLSYFTAIVENIAKTGNKHIAASVFTSTVQTVKRCKHKKISSEYEEKYDYYNWIYLCSNCKTEFDAWATECPGCKSKIEN